MFVNNMKNLPLLYSAFGVCYLPFPSYDKKQGVLFLQYWSGLAEIKSFGPIASLRTCA